TGEGGGEPACSRPAATLGRVAASVKQLRQWCCPDRRGGPPPVTRPSRRGRHDLSRRLAASRSRTIHRTTSSRRGEDLLVTRRARAQARHMEPAVARAGEPERTDAAQERGWPGPKEAQEARGAPDRQP